MYLVRLFFGNEWIFGIFPVVRAWVTHHINSMNRREFGKIVVGTGVAAAVPVSGMAGAAAVQAQRSKYIFAVALAHNRTDVTAEMISEMFNVRPSEARGFIRKMVRNGVVGEPNAQGVARLAEPLQRITSQLVEYNPQGGYLVKGRLDEMKAKAKEMAEKLFEDDAPETDVSPEEISLSDDDPVRPAVSDEAHSAG